MKRIVKSSAALMLVALTLVAGVASSANAARLSGYQDWAQDAFDPKCEC